MLEDEPDIVAPVGDMVESLRARLQAAEGVIRQARLKVQGDMARETILGVLDTPLPSLPGIMVPPTKLQTLDPRVQEATARVTAYLDKIEAVNASPRVVGYYDVIHGFDDITLTRTDLRILVEALAAQPSTDPGAHGGPIPRYAMHDVWSALRGLPYFDSWYTQRGYALAWADLMGAIRGVRAAQHYIDLLAVDLLAVDPEALEKVIAKAMLDSWSDEREHADSPQAITRAVIEYLEAQQPTEGEWEHAVRDRHGRILFTATAGAAKGDVAIKRRPAGPWIEEQP